MPWSDEDRDRYGAALRDSPDRDQLRAIVEAWVGAHPGTDPAELMGWMEGMLDHDPLVLFDDADTGWMIETLYGGHAGMTGDVALAAFSGLGAGP